MNSAPNPELLVHIDLLNGFESIYIGVLTMGIFYGLTLCSFSCLPLIGPYIFGTQPGMRSGLSATGVFVLAKVLTYTLLGALSGLLGGVLLERVQPGWLLLVSGVAVTVISIFVWRRRATCKPHGKQPAEPTSPWRVWRHMATMGIVTSLMPCLPLSAVLLYAATTQSMATGAALALLFGLGTAASPLYYIGGGSAGWLSKKIREAIPTHQGLLQRLSSLILMMMGLKLLYLGYTMTGLSL